MLPVLRRYMKPWRGQEYEYDGDGGAIMVFHTPHEAVRWCCDVQKALQRVAWPSRLLELECCQQELDADSNVVISGLRVSMGVISGMTRWSIVRHRRGGKLGLRDSECQNLAQQKCAKLCHGI